MKNNTYTITIDGKKYNWSLTTYAGYKKWLKIWCNENTAIYEKLIDDETEITPATIETIIRIRKGT